MPRTRGDKPRRDDQAVKIARDLAKKAYLIARSREIPAAELLSDLLRPLIEREWQKELKRMAQGDTSL